MFGNKKNYYVEKVAKETGRKYKDVLAEMELDHIKFGLTFRDYYIGEIHRVRPHEKKKEALSVVNNRKKRKERVLFIKEKTGRSAKSILRDLNRLNEKDIFNVSLAAYEKYGMFEKSEETNIILLENLKKRELLVKELRKRVKLIDKGELTYDEFQKELDEVYALTKIVLTDDYRLQLISRFRNIIPDSMKSEETMAWIADDMEVTRLVLRFGHTEYLMFRFFEKTIEERRAFLSSTERRRVLNKKNDSEASAVLNNKFLCYSRVKDYYGREAILLNDKKSFKAFRNFTDRHPVFVIKPTELSFGKGIMKIKAADKSELQGQFKELLESYGEFMIEELITQHSVTEALNPDSVNTVRIPTYYNGEKTIVQRPFMKVGRAGSFVDNGGSGGIFVGVDYETGKLIGNGIDEEGIVYACHPESGIVFDGYQLPNWDEVKKLANVISNKIENAAYIGWDLACTNENKWIVVEGNAMTQFIGQQATINKGMREEFFREIK